MKVLLHLQVQFSREVFIKIPTEQANVHGDLAGAGN